MIFVCSTCPDCLGFYVFQVDDMEDVTRVGFNCVKDNHPLGDFEEMKDNDLRDMAGLSYPQQKGIGLTPEEQEQIKKMLADDGSDVSSTNKLTGKPKISEPDWTREPPTHPFKIPKGMSENAFIEKFKNACRKKPEPTDWQAALNALPRPQRPKQ